MTKQHFQTLDTTATQQNRWTKSRYIYLNQKQIYIYIYIYTHTSYFSAFNSVCVGVCVGKEAYREHSHVVFCHNK